MNLRSVKLVDLLADEIDSWSTPMGAGCVMADCTLVLKLDANQVLAEIALLTQAAKGSLQVRQRLLGLGNLASHLVCFDDDAGPATPAGQLGVRLQFSDALLELVSAVRAGQFDGLVVQEVFHG